MAGPFVGAGAGVNISVIRAMQAVQAGEQQQALLERAIGRAFLQKMQGMNPDLLQTYIALGGSDPVVQQILGGPTGQAFQQLNLANGVQAAQTAALSDAVRNAASSKGSDLQSNVLATLPGQALNTLAGLGGAAFAAKYNIQQP